MKDDIPRSVHEQLAGYMPLQQREQYLKKHIAKQKIGRKDVIAWVLLLFLFIGAPTSIILWSNYQQHLKDVKANSVACKEARQQYNSDVNAYSLSNDQTKILQADQDAINQACN